MSENADRRLALKKQPPLGAADACVCELGDRVMAQPFGGSP
jgi:hypothetical protein